SARALANQVRSAPSKSAPAIDSENRTDRPAPIVTRMNAAFRLCSDPRRRKASPSANSSFFTRTSLWLGLDIVEHRDTGLHRLAPPPYCRENAGSGAPRAPRL